jgi:hypothetical protein
MPVDNGEVARIIAEALAAFPGEAGCCDANWRAFRMLQARRREPGRSVDENLAAAEHFMFARAMVCSATVSPTQMRLMVLGYDVSKMILQVVGAEGAMQTTANPTSRASTAQIGWGLLGVQRGSEDHDRCNAAAEAPLINMDAAQYGSRYYGSSSR